MCGGYPRRPPRPYRRIRTRDECNAMILAMILSGGVAIICLGLLIGQVL